MQTKVQLNSARLAPRKVRAVVNLIKRKGVMEALDQLEHMVKRPTLPLSKLLRSAIANAENNFSMVKENLFIKDITVNEGMKLRRIRPSAYGMAKQIQKKTSHIMIVLDERVPGLKRKAAAQPKAEHDHEHKESKKETKKPEIKKEESAKTTVTAKKKLFQRKSI